MSEKEKSGIYEKIKKIPLIGAVARAIMWMFGRDD